MHIENTKQFIVELSVPEIEKDKSLVKVISKQKRRED